MAIWLMQTIAKVAVRAGLFNALIVIAGAFASLASEYLLALLLTNAAFVIIFGIAIFNLKKKVWLVWACVMPSSILLSLLITSVRTGWFEFPAGSEYLLGLLIIGSTAIFLIADHKMRINDAHRPLT